MIAADVSGRFCSARRQKYLEVFGFVNLPGKATWIWTYLWGGSSGDSLGLLEPHFRQQY